MAGYHGWSMSNNAVECYENNIKPKTRWLKDEILHEIRDAYGDDAYTRAKKHTVGFLRDSFLVYDSWHHTGKHYRCTDFYRFCDELENDKVVQILEEVEVKEEKEIPVPFPAIASWVEWSGSRNHPKAEEVKGFGRVVGNFFICTDGVRKRIDGKHFYFKELEEKKAREIFKKEYHLKTSHRYRKWLEIGKVWSR